MLKVKIENSRCNWSREETKELLAIIKEQKVMELLGGKTRRNRNVYELLADELAKKGFNKNREQVKLKFRNLKQQFLKTKRANGKSGAGRQTLEFYDDLDELVGNRPVAAATGLDTTVVDEMMEVVCEKGLACDLAFENVEYVEDEPPDEGPQARERNMEKVSKKKRSAIQMTLLDIAEDLKESHQLTLKAIKEENAVFMTEQRRLHEQYLKDTKDIMAEDRKETKQMLLDLLKK